MKITIQQNTLKALVYFAAKKDIRYYLQGVLIEQCASGTYAVATDGHCIAVARINSEPAEPCQVIIGREHLENANKGNKFAIVIDCPNQAEPGQLRRVTLSSGNGETAVTEIDGRFPDWRRVIRAEITGERAYYNPDLVTLVNKAGQAYALRKAGYHISQAGNNAGHCAFDTEFHAWVMPMREHVLNLEPVAAWVMTA
jgi:DNA polymerase-3 subunit beta